MDRKNILIVALAGSAFLLMSLLVLIQLFSVPQNTLASGQQSGGDYAITTAQTTNGEDALWVFDTRSRNIGIYQYDNAQRQLQLRRVFPMGQAEAGTAR